MNPTQLVKRELLDPRPENEAGLRPIAGAVNIPFAELSARLHELPPKSEIIQVVGPPDLATTVVEWLTQHGRVARVVAGQAEATADTSPVRSEARANEVGRLWEPSAFLEEVAGQLRLCAGESPGAPGSALDLACGSGRNAVFLACCGWKVTAVDILPDALDLGRELERLYARGWHAVKWICADIHTANAGGTPQPNEYAGGTPWPQQVLPERMGPQQLGWRPDEQFDLVTMFRYLDRGLVRQLPDWVKPGGSIVLETFTTEHRQRHGRPARAAHVLRPGELRELFAAVLSRMRLRHYSEGWRGAEHTARLWVQCSAPGN